MDQIRLYCIGASRILPLMATLTPDLRPTKIRLLKIRVNSGIYVSYHESPA